jgi:hypothetical protein
MCKRCVDGAFGETGFVRDRAHTGADGPPSTSRCLAVQVQINEVGGRFLVVSDQVAHQHIQNVIVDRDALFKARIST